MPEKNASSIEQVKDKLMELVDDVVNHDGFGDIKVEVKILKRRQKEVILHYGKQYRYVVSTAIPISPKTDN